jgi:hypothetical protein
MPWLQAAPEEELAIDTDGAFGRLLVHGLAEFHGLGSRSEGAKTEECRPVVVYHRQQGGRAQGQEGGGAAAPAQPLHGQQVEVTCTDVLLALRELGHSGLDQHSLAAFVRAHVHGHDQMDGDFVLV